MPKYVLVVVLTHLLERPLPSSCLRRRTKGQAVRSDLSGRPCLGSLEQVAPTELARAGADLLQTGRPSGAERLMGKDKVAERDPKPKYGPKIPFGDRVVFKSGSTESGSRRKRSSIHRLSDSLILRFSDSLSWIDIIPEWPYYAVGERLDKRAYGYGATRQRQGQTS